LASDQFAEYGDSAFLGRVGITLSRRPLAAFWPEGGPRWDALGRSGLGEIILVEAKAHVPELLSTPSHASADALARIRDSLDETARALGASGGGDWATRFYQVTNRLAHGYLLQHVNGIPTRLVFLYLIGDRDMDGPATRREWDAALLVLEEALGLRGRMPPWVRKAFVDVEGPDPKPVA
jgi:hypothetical protein